MANYVPSDLVTAQAILIDKFKNEELRFRDPVVFKQFLRKNEIAIPGLAMLRTREDRPVEAYFKNRTSRALGTARTHNHTGTHGDSTAFTPTFLERTDEFAISLKQGDNNVFSHAEMLANEFEQVIINFAEGWEQDAQQFTFNNRSQVSTATAESTFDGITFANEIVDATNGDRAIQITKTGMHENKYSGSLTVFCDTISFNRFNFQANQGNANNTNLSFQFNNITFVHSVEMNASAASLAYTKGFWVVVEDGALAGIDWIPKQNTQGVDTKVNAYGTILNPIDGLTYALHSYEERSDSTATNGYNQDVLSQFQVSVDVALESAPLTTANETVLQAFALI